MDFALAWRQGPQMPLKMWGEPEIPTTQILLRITTTPGILSRRMPRHQPMPHHLLQISLCQRQKTTVCYIDHPAFLNHTEPTIPLRYTTMDPALPPVAQEASSKGLCSHLIPTSYILNGHSATPRHRPPHHTRWKAAKRPRTHMPFIPRLPFLATSRQSLS